MKSEQQFVSAVLDAPYLFRIKVEDKEALPEELKNTQELCFELGSPTMGVLFQVSKVFLQLPKEDLKVLDEQGDLSSRLELIERHMDKLLEVMALLLHGKESAPPTWYAPFLRANLTSKEVVELFSESLARLDTSFFFDLFERGSKHEPASRKYNPLSMIAAAMHHFGVSFSEVMWNMSYRKLILLSGSVPGYEEDEPRGKDENIPLQELIASSGGQVVD